MEKNQIIYILIQLTLLSQTIKTQTVGEIFFDDFNSSGTVIDGSKWMTKTQGVVDNTKVNQKEISINHAQQKSLALNNQNDHTITKVPINIQLEYDDYIYVAFDHLDLEFTQTSKRYVRAGILDNYSYTSESQKVLITRTAEVGQSYYRPPHRGWIHIEAKVQSTYNQNRYFRFINQGTGIDSCYFDNISISSIHGHQEINTDPLTNLMKGVQILSRNYGGWTGTFSETQQFNFMISDVDTILGRNDWDSGTFAMYIPELEHKAQVTLYRSSGGGSIGDGYGRFVDDSGHQDQQYIFTGSYMFFSKTFSSDVSDLEIETGTCDYEGPNKKKHLGLCVNFCEDFETLAEAMQVCNDLEECQGVTYTHKYWGDQLSKGFGKLNYGYQLRKFKDQSNKQLEDEGREFEHSWVKRATPLAYPCIMVQECGYACDTCSSNVCSNCKDGYYLESGSCKKCDSSCLTCTNLSSCSACAIQHYDDSGTCIKCMDKCQSCNNGDNCLIDCPTANCSKCDDSGVCQHCDRGFQLNVGTKNCESYNIILEDDFNGYTTQFDILKWTNYLDNQMSPSDAAPFTVETPMFGEQQGAQFYGNSSIGTIDSTTDISPVPYDNHIWLALDYQDQISPREFEMGFSFSFVGIMGTNDIAIKSTEGPACSNWQHREVKFELDSERKFNVNLRKNNGNNAMIDNVVVSTTHGPHYYNKDSLSIIYRGFQIQSIDYDGYTAQSSDKQVFNFYCIECDNALGRKDWSQETFAMLIGEFNIVAEVVLYRQRNGGRIGDCYGEFVDPSSYTSQKHFTTGEWMFFSPDFTSSVFQFQKYDGFSQMVGPYKQKHLAYCVNECEDFETLQEAVKRCTEIIECEGITYTHKYDGDSNSKGFAGGYGFQLRKHELQEPHADLPRYFEYTWISRIEPIPIDSPFSNFDRAFCQNYSNNACQLCVTGYYVDGDGRCQICQKQCESCSDGITCDSCVDGYYSSASDCLQCDDTVCATCNGDATTCTQNCPSNCLKCNGDGHCLVCEDAYMKKLNKCVLYNQLLHDDFSFAGSTPDSSIWRQSNGANPTSMELIDPCTNGSKCFNFKTYGFSKMVYSLNTFDKVPYDTEFFMMFDAMTIDDNPQFMVGFTQTNSGSVTHILMSSYSAHSSQDYYINMSNKENIWNHFEGRVRITTGNSYYIVMLLNTGPASAHFLDNFYLMSAHGPHQINRSPYLFTNPGVQILSKEYDSYTEDSAQFAQFNFDSYSLDQQMGRSDWNGEIFAVYIPHKDIKGQVRLSRTHNGGRYGDAWGRFTDLSSTYQNDHTIFRTGEYIIFGKDFTTDPTELDFENKSKICAFAGPFLSQNFQDCSDDCRDYETLHEAMEACEASGDCEGVTFAHKLWGGLNSSGFDKYLGYGYQLRKGILETQQIRRQYQTSWTKRPTKLTSDCEEITVCGKECAQCTTGTQTCTQAIKGFYLDGDSKPQRCDMTKCAECSDFSTFTVPIEDKCLYSNSDTSCLACKLGTYRQGVQCLPCADQCITCSMAADNCVLECFQGCSVCNFNTCTQTAPGFYYDGVIKKCDFELCSRCTDAVTCEPGYEIPTGCKLTNELGICLIPKDGYYIDGGGVAQECDDACTTCEGPSNTECGSAAPGYYFPDINDKTNVQQCDHTICATCISAVACTISCIPGCTLCDAQENCHATVPGYYLDGGVLTQCDHDLCATCSSATVCIIPCTDNCKTCNVDNECQVPDAGYYLDGSGAVQQCDHTKCATCSSLILCIIPCQSGCTLCDSENLCHETEPGKYLDGTVLKNCDHNLCATCTSATDCIIPCEINCATCDSSNICQSASTGYYLDSNIIKQCNNRVCATCSTSAETCILPCNSGCGSCDIQGNCLSCPFGYYLNSQSCEKCLDKCRTCSNGTSCDSCSDEGSNRSLTPPLCGCKENHFQVENTLDCQTCTNPLCIECDSSGACNTCRNSNMIPPLCKTSKSGGFFAKPSSGSDNETSMQQCSVQCRSCENSFDNCLTCVEGNNRKYIPPNCKCLYGYHDYQGQTKDCTPCPSMCLSCIDSDICLECDEDQYRELNEFSHMCECKKGYKENSHNECQKCYMFEEQCLIQCPREMQQNEQDFRCEVYNINKSDNMVAILLCSLTLIGFIGGANYFMTGIHKKFVIDFSQKEGKKPIIESREGFNEFSEQYNYTQKDSRTQKEIKIEIENEVNQEKSQQESSGKKKIQMEEEQHNYSQTDSNRIKKLEIEDEDEDQEHKEYQNFSSRMNIVEINDQQNISKD